MQNDTYSTRIEGQESTNTQQPNASHINPGVEAMQEVTLQTSNFAAEFGEVGGGLSTSRLSQADQFTARFSSTFETNF